MRRKHATCRALGHRRGTQDRDREFQGTPPSWCCRTSRLLELGKSSHEFQRKDAFTIEYHLTLPKESTGNKKTVVTLSYNRLNVQATSRSY